MIRVANIKDIPKINLIGNQLHQNFAKIYHLETELNSELAIVLVNEDKNVINGYLYAIDFIDNIDLMSIAVDKSYQGQKIGENLLKYLIDNYCYQNKTITLEVSTDNNIAINLYKKFNFKIVNNSKFDSLDIMEYVDKEIVNDNEYIPVINVTPTIISSK